MKHHQPDGTGSYSLRLDSSGRDVDDLGIWHRMDSRLSLWNEFIHDSWNSSADVGNILLTPESSTEKLERRRVRTKRQTRSRHLRLESNGTNKTSNHKSTARKPKKKKKTGNKADVAEVKRRSKKYRQSTNGGEDEGSSVTFSPSSSSSISMLPSPGAKESRQSPRKEKKRRSKQKKKSRKDSLEGKKDLQSKRLQLRQAQSREEWGIGCVGIADFEEFIEAYKSQQKQHKQEKAFFQTKFVGESPWKEGFEEAKARHNHSGNAKQDELGVKSKNKAIFQNEIIGESPSKEGTKARHNRSDNTKQVKLGVKSKSKAWTNQRKNRSAKLKFSDFTKLVKLSPRRSPRRSPPKSPRSERNRRFSQLLVESDGSSRALMPSDRELLAEKLDESDMRRDSIRKSLADIIGGDDELRASLALPIDNGSEIQTVTKPSQASNVTTDTHLLGPSGGSIGNGHGSISSKKRRKPKDADKSKLRGFFFRS
eukprot:scaffold10490_cov129-Cylindrotheca_fusiformis.AAC.7